MGSICWLMGNYIKGRIWMNCWGVWDLQMYIILFESFTNRYVGIIWVPKYFGTNWFDRDIIGRSCSHIQKSMWRSVNCMPIFFSWRARFDFFRLLLPFRELTLWDLFQKNDKFQFLIVAINYITKWVKANLLAKIT